LNDVANINRFQWRCSRYRSVSFH